jgi:hypothetical protein
MQGWRARLSLYGQKLKSASAPITQSQPIVAALTAARYAALIIHLKPRHQAAHSKSSQSQPDIAMTMAAMYPLLISIQRVLRIRLWCETRLRMP